MKLAITANDRTYSIQLPWWLILAALLSAVLWQPAAAWASNTFSDVPSSHIFHDDVDWMAASGITKGCNPPTNDKYCPDDNVTRGQMAAFMHRFADIQVASLEAEVATLEGEVDALQRLLAGVTRSRTGDRMVLTGMDLQVVNGTGTTGGTPNGLGNLIIGYDAPRPSRSDTSGSHYLVVGDQHNYTSYGGIVAGFRNTASTEWASVSGGIDNHASGPFASVSGGRDNTASGWGASVFGGNGNHAIAHWTTVSGGYQNTASGEHALVAGGSENTASGDHASVSGGHRNTANGHSASVSGGYKNTASGNVSSILGGNSKSASTTYACHPSCA